MAISSPLDIPNCVLWLSADSESANFADGAQMGTQWTDQSGNANHAIAGKSGTSYMTWHATGGANNGPYIQSNSSGHFTLPSMVTMLPGATSMEIIASFMGPVSGDDWSFWDWNNTNNDFPWGSTINEPFGMNSGSRENYGWPASFRSWSRYNLWAANNDWAAIGNGVTLKTDATRGAPNLTYASPHIGYVPVNGRNAKTLKYGAIVLYSRKLTAAERSDLDAWLTANPSGGTSGGGGTPSGPTIKYWDGAAEQSATLEGQWDGAAIQPVNALGWWDGAAVQPLG